MIKFADIRRALAHPAQHILYASGLLNFFSSRNESAETIILMYHSVADAEDAAWIDPRNHLTPAAFEAQISFLARHRRVISLSELVRSLKDGRTCAAGTVVITFDDGYLDNLKVAAPILSRYQLPATLFLPTGYIDRAEPQWIDAIYNMFQFRSRDRLMTDGALSRTYDLRNSSDLAASYRALCRTLLEAVYGRRTEILNQVREQLKPTHTPPRLTMNWDDVRKLVQENRSFELGGHTADHLDLTHCENTQAEHEVRECRIRIESETDASPQHFSFPYGRSRPDLCKLVEQCGFESACSSDGAPLIGCRTDRYALPRVEAPLTAYRFGFLTSSANSGLLYRAGR
jgi:peptidoglycan/xylan/chitin deacetylase (PgdA/CDA1 family)